MGRMANAWSMTLVLLTMLLLVCIPPTLALSPPEKEDLILDRFAEQDYSAKVDLGEKATFAWALMNLNSTHSYDIEVRAWTDSKEWDVEPEETTFQLRPGTTRSVQVEVLSKDGEDGDATTVFLSITLVESGTGATYYINDTAAVMLDYKLKEGIDVLFWHVELPGEMDNPIGRFLILLGLWCIAVFVLIVLIIDGILRSVTRKTKTKADDIVLDIIRRPAIVLAIAYGIVDTLEVLDIPRDWISGLFRVFVLVAIAVGAYVVYKILKDVLVYYGELHAKTTGSEAAKMVIPLINNIFSVIIFIAAGSLMLSYLGYDITVAVAGMGIIGLVVAFAAQDTLSNFFSGLHLLVDRPFKKGDLVILETGEICSIRDIGFRSARLYEVVEHVIITMPNNRLANAKIINISAPDFNYRMRIEVSVAYGSDVKLVKRTLLDVAKVYPDIMKDADHPPRVRFRKFGDSSLNFELYVWIEDIRQEKFLIMNRVRSDLNELVDEAFRKNDIKIPFPQREIWVSSMPDKGKAV